MAAAVGTLTDESSTKAVLLPGALVYIASEDPSKNENYLGPASVEELAAQIASARGPSGPNAEYLFRLVDALVQVRSHMRTAFAE